VVKKLGVDVLVDDPVLVEIDIIRLLDKTVPSTEMSSAPSGASDACVALVDSCR
jgi:hypothetical protein